MFNDTSHSIVGQTLRQNLRAAIRKKEKLEIGYLSLGNQASSRVVWPLQNAYWGRVWTMTCWCENRSNFRSFRIDRITSCKLAGAYFVDQHGRRLEDYLVKVNADMKQNGESD